MFRLLHFGQYLKSHNFLIFFFRKPATKKISMLPTVMAQLKKADLQVTIFSKVLTYLS